MISVRSSRLVGSKGFTLVEILLAMLITSVLILGINAAYQQAHLIWSSAEYQRPIYHTARLITETLRQELSCLYIPQISEEGNCAFELVYLPNEKTELAFYTLVPCWKGSLGSSRPAKVRYRFTRNRETGKMLLERSEQLCAGEKTVGTESSDVVVEGLADFRAWVIDPNSSPRRPSWKESYNSKETPPKALKVFLKWEATDRAPEVSLSCRTLIACESPLR
jgi:prepilin-type N-terminal cleavage/methylation domain-containing protein